MKNKNLFLISLVIVVCTERLEKIFYVGFFDLYPSRVLFVILLLYFNLNTFLKTSSKETRQIFYLFLIFTSFVFLSVFKSDDFAYSFKKWLDFLTIHSFVFLTYSFLQVSANAITAEGLYELFVKYFNYILIIVFIGGLFIYDTIGDTNILEERTFGSITFLRRTSVFRDPNFYSCFLTLAFFIVYFSSMPRRKLFIILVFISLFLTGSKGGIGALGLTLIIYYRKKIVLLKSDVFLYSILAASLGILLFLMLYPYEVFDLLSNSNYFQTGYGTETILPRILTWHSGMKAYLSEPLLGIGPGNIVNIAKGQSIDSLLIYIQSGGFYGLEYDQIDKLATHSIYLEILFESGIFAFGFYMLYLYKILNIMINFSNRFPNIFHGITLGFISFFISIVFLSYNTYYLSFFIGLSLFLVDIKRKEVALV